MKSFLELGGDVVSTQVAGLGVLDAANSVLEGLGVSVDKVAGNLKTEEDYFITAEGELLDWRRTTLTGYVYITTTKAVTDCQEAIRKDPQYDPQRYEEYNYMDLLVQHSSTKKLRFRNTLLSEPFDLPYSYFKRFAAVIYGEMGRYENNENEAKAIGCTIINAIRMHCTHIPSIDNFARIDTFLAPVYTKAPEHGQYKAYVSNSHETILKIPNMRTALIAALYAIWNYGLSNATDVSNGATHWDGSDFAQLGTKHDKPLNNGIYIANEAHLINYARYWDILIEKDKTRLRHFRGENADTTNETLVKINSSSGNYELALSPNPYPATGTNEGRVLHISAAQYGGTIFWAPNYNEPLNDGYDWKYLVDY